MGTQRLMACGEVSTISDRRGAGGGDYGTLTPQRVMLPGAGIIVIHTWRPWELVGEGVSGVCSRNLFVSNFAANSRGNQELVLAVD